MSKQLAVLKDELKTLPSVKTLYWCYEQMKEGKIVTIPPFLQRQLQKRVWEMTGNTKSKQYLYVDLQQPVSESDTAGCFAY